MPRGFCRIAKEPLTALATRRPRPVPGSLERPPKAAPAILDDHEQATADRASFDVHLALVSLICMADDVRARLVHGETEVRDRLLAHPERGGELGNGAANLAQGSRSAPGAKA